MLSDFCGNTVSLDNPDAVQSWDRMQRAFLAHGARTADHLAKALELSPGFAMGHAVKGLFMLMLGRRELVGVAVDALATANQCVVGRGATDRERAYLAALEAWIAGRPSMAVAAMERIVAAHPRDALAVKIDHAIRFILGDGIGMRRAIDRALPGFDDHPARGYILGCHAFALEETGDYAAAERTGHAALALAPDDAWGLHAVAHVHDMTGRAADGLRWFAGREAAWAHCNNFRYHVWWHKALMHLDLGQTDAVLALYDGQIRCDRTDDYRDISNAASLLCRLELDGVDVGNRWEELAALAQNRTEDGSLIFADLHYLLALIGGDRGDARTALIGRIRRDAAVADTEMTQRMARPGLAAAAGLDAFGDGNYAAAYTHLRAARPAMQLAGGSHAQRDVFERLTIDAAFRGGFHSDAKALLGERRQKRGGYEDGYCAARMALIARQEERETRHASL